MAEKLIISWDEYNKTVEELAVKIHSSGFKVNLLIGIMRGAAPIIDILSRVMKLPIAYIVIQSYSGEGMEDQQGQLMFAREISSLANDKDFKNRNFYDILMINKIMNKYVEQDKIEKICEVFQDYDLNLRMIENLLKIDKTIEKIELKQKRKKIINSIIKKYIKS